VHITVLCSCFHYCCHSLNDVLHDEREDDEEFFLELLLVGVVDYMCWDGWVGVEVKQVFLMGRLKVDLRIFLKIFEILKFLFKFLKILNIFKNFKFLNDFFKI
jgi:hypothetical protein